MNMRFSTLIPFLILLRLKHLYILLLCQTRKLNFGTKTAFLVWINHNENFCIAALMKLWTFILFLHYYYFTFLVGIWRTYFTCTLKQTSWILNYHNTTWALINSFLLNLQRIFSGIFTILSLVVQSNGVYCFVVFIYLILFLNWFAHTIN